MAEETKPKMMDGAMMNDVITLYLYGVYALKKGRLTPPEAMKKVVQLARVMEKAGAMGESVRRWIKNVSFQHSAVSDRQNPRG